MARSTSMLTCDQAYLLMRYGAEPGTQRKGLPELGFHVASCPDCHALWTGAPRSAEGTPSTADDSGYRAAAPATLFPGFQHPASSAHESRADDSYACLSDLQNAEPPTNRLSDRPHVAAFAPVAAPDLESAAGVSLDDSRFGGHDYSDQQPGGLISYRMLLQNRNFRLLWFGQAVSTFGSLFTRIAIPIYVYNLTNSLSQLGFAAFSSLVAPLCFGLFAGALVDRWNRRRTMLAVDIISATVLLILMVISFMDLSLPLKLASLYAINFVMALLRELFNPARVAIFPEVVKDEELLAANSLDQATTTFGELVSYPVAGFALFYFGASMAFGINALTFLLSAVLLLGVRTRVSAQDTTEQTSLIREIGAGLSTIKRLPMVRVIVVLSLIVPAMMSLFNTLQLPYAVEAVGSTQEVGYPALEAMTALGFTLGVLALGRWGQRISRSSLMVAGICTLGFAILAQGVIPLLGEAFGISTGSESQSPWTLLLFLALPCTLLAGAANSVLFVCIRTVLQEETPRNLLGRVASVVSVAAGVGFAGGALLTGLGQGRVAMLIVLLGVTMLTVGIGCHWWFRKRQQIAPATGVLLRPSANVVEKVGMS